MAKIVIKNGEISSTGSINIVAGSVSSSLFINSSSIGINTDTPDSALDIQDGYITLSELFDEPSLPSPGKAALYVSSSDSKIYFKNDLGDVYDLTLGGSGSNGTGDITSVAAGINLTGGGINGDVTLALTSSITSGLNNISGVATINATSITGSFSGDGGNLINITRKLVHFINNGPVEEYTSSYLEITPIDTVFPTSSIWYTDTGKTKKVYEEFYQRSGSGTQINPNPIIYKLYKEDGVTVLIEATDTITYTQYGASAISRSISSSLY